MPLVEFTPNLARQTNAPACRVDGATVGEVLRAVFAATPALRGYVLDDQGAVRTHVVVFIDGSPMRDRSGLSDAVRPDSEIFVMQALSGG
jgi:sulfur-carrier protein